MALNQNVVREQNARLDALVRTPTFVVVAGSLPGLFAATSLENGAAIGAVTAVSIIAMAVLARAIASFTGAFSRTVCMLMVSATVAVLLGFAVRVADPVVYESLGMYIPLASMNALVVLYIIGDHGFMAAPCKTSPLGTAVFGAVCAFLTLTFVGFINGMFTTGQVLGLTMNELAASPLAVFGTPAGSLLVLALVAVFVQSIEQACVKDAPNGADGTGAAASKGGER